MATNPLSEPPLQETFVPVWRIMFETLWPERSFDIATTVDELAIKSKLGLVRFVLDPLPHETQHILFYKTIFVGLLFIFHRGFLCFDDQS